MKNNIVVYTLIMGVAIGVLSTSLYTKITENRKIRTEYLNWAKLNLILQQVQLNYVDTLDVKSMTDAAVVSALAELDPHSIYLPPVDLKEADGRLSGNFDGIGITFNVPADTAIVINVIPGGPSEKAGLMPGDRIIKVDEKVIAGVKMPQDTMISNIKGPSGSKVKITVLRDKEEIPFNMSRDKIPVKSLTAAFMMDDSTAYIKLDQFTRTTYEEFENATDHLLEQGMKRILLDLRDNSGGYFDQAYKLSNDFLEKGDLVVYMEGRKRNRSDYNANGRGRLKDIGISVLINESSASSSEIVAGAIQDNDRGQIVGRRSFGKGLVQEPVNFTDGSGIRLTVARFHTPSGRCIQKPYSKTYDYDIYERYAHGEMTEVDSIKVDKELEYFTVGGRAVYGGGGIIPDIFVPIDTTKATKFYIASNKKALPMRFASKVFDENKAFLSKIEDFEKLDSWIKNFDVSGNFLEFAASEGIKPAKGEWDKSKEYMLPQLKGLIGRYSKLDDDAFYRFYMEVDETIIKAYENSSKVRLPFEGIEE